MAMSKKDYEQIAACIREEVRNIAILAEGSEMRISAAESVQNICYRLANRFYLENSRFDREKFYYACGLHYHVSFGWLVPVVKPQKVTNIFDGKHISCKDCGSEEFYSMGRSRDYNNWKCVQCGKECSTLTETGASA